MIDSKFIHSNELLVKLSFFKLEDGSRLSTRLHLETKVSLLDIVAPYLVLYRFPLLFRSIRQGMLLRQRYMHFFPLYGNIFNRFRASMLMRPREIAKNEKVLPDERHILFLGFYEMFYRDVLHPVADVITNKNLLNSIIVDDKYNDKLIRYTNNRLTRISIWEYWDEVVSNLSKNMLLNLADVESAFFQKKNFKVLLDYLVAGNDDLDGSIVKLELKWLFNCVFKKLIPYIASAKRIFECVRPSLIVSADDTDQRNRVYTLLGKAYGVQSLVVQQGLTDVSYPDWKYFSADYVAAMGEAASDHIASQGISREKIVVTGHPGFDRLVNDENRDDIRDSMGIACVDKLLLFASQPYLVGAFASPDIRKEMIEAVLEVCDTFGGVQVILKPHPSENIREFKKLIGKRRSVYLANKEMDILPLIKACDVFITFFSTAALQALYAAKPVINVCFENSSNFDLYLNSGATYIARSRREIASYLRRLVSTFEYDKNVKMDIARLSFVNRWAHVPDGCATRRVVDLACQLIGEICETVEEKKKEYSYGGNSDLKI